MTQDMRRELTPQQYIRQLFSETKDGKLEITYHYPLDIEEPYAIAYDMDWTEADAENLVRQYDSLVAQLQKFGTLQTELLDGENRRILLTPEEQKTWEIFIQPPPPFEVDESVIEELYFRGEFDSLEDEENELLERHWWWRERYMRERMPFLRCSPTGMILRARRYEKLVGWNAPEVVIQEEGRGLAEEMVLYYHGPRQEQTFEEV